MKWLDRVRKVAEASPAALTKPTQASFAVFVGSSPAPFAQNEGFSEPEFSDDCPPNFLDEQVDEFEQPERQQPVAEPGSTFDRSSGPHADHAHGREDPIALVMLFHRRGLRHEDAQALALDVAARALDLDDRRICLECRRLNGKRCTVPDKAGAGEIVTPFLRIPQRCPGFEAAT